MQNPHRFGTVLLYKVVHNRFVSAKSSYVAIISELFGSFDCNGQQMSTNAGVFLFIG